MYLHNHENRAPVTYTGKLTSMKRKLSRPAISKSERDVDSAGCVLLYGSLMHHKRNEVRGVGKGGLRRAPKDPLH